MTNLSTAVSLDVIIPAATFLFAVVAVYVTLKSKIDVLEKISENQSKEITILQQESKILKNDFSNLQKEVAANHNKLETSMAQMELRIIREFQSVVTQIVNQKEK